MNIMLPSVSVKKISFTTVKVIVGSLVMAISAQVSIPLPFVSITFQTIAMAFLALSLGSKAGFISVALYLLEGLVGLPVFANGGFGSAVLFGPSGGYLFGCLAGVFFIGYCAEKGLLGSYLSTFIIFLLSSSLVYAIGLTQLSIFVPQAKLLMIGMYPFILGDLLKAVVFASIATKQKF